MILFLQPINFRPKFSKKFQNVQNCIICEYVNKNYGFNKYIHSDVFGLSVIVIRCNRLF